MQQLMSKCGQWILDNHTTAVVWIFVLRALEMFGPTFINLDVLLMFFNMGGLLAYAMLALMVLSVLSNQYWQAVLFAALPSVFAYWFIAAPAMGLLMPVIVVLSIVVLGRMLFLHQCWSCGVECMSIIIIVAILGLHTFIDDVPSWWMQQLGFNFEQLVNSLNVEITAKQQALQFYNMVAPRFSGYIAAMWMLVIPIWLVHFGRVWRMKCQPNSFKDYQRGIMVGRVLAAIGSLAMIAGYWSSSAILVDLQPLWNTLFTLIGLSAVHDCLQNQPQKPIVLAVLYVALLFQRTLPGVVLVLSIFGCADCFFGLRKKIIKHWSN